MKRCQTLAVLIAIVTAGSVAMAKDAATAPVSPATDNRQPPYLAVWKEPKYLPDGIKEYNQWLNRQLVWVDMSSCMFYGPAKTWPQIELSFDRAWGQWVAEVPGRRAILSVPMLPADGSTLALGATGAYDSHFTALAKNLVESHLGNTILCMGPVSDWGTAWKVSGKEDAAHFAQYWRQIVDAMRAVPGGEKLQFDWVGPGAKPNYPIDDAYPADKYVDYIGWIVNEGSGDKRIYPYPAFASDSEKVYRQQRAWELTERPALDVWCAFAKAHGKPFSIPRWNLTAGHARDMGLDAPAFIEGMHSYIHDPANNVYFASYMEYYHYSWLSPTNGYKDAFPKSAEMFRKLFALPSTDK